MGCAQVFLNTQQIDGRRGGGCAEVLAVYFATECMLLQVEESRSPLDIGQCFRPGLLQSFEHLAAGERPLELAHEFFQVMLHHSI